MSRERDITDIEILFDLIRINSENPGGNELRISNYCRDLLGRFGIPSEIREKDVNRPNVIAKLEGRGSGKLIYQAHLDTKPAYHAGATEGNWATNPFVPVVLNGRIYGLGACDTKGGMAAQLSAIIRLSQSWNSSLPTLEWQGVADEENGSGHGCDFLSACGLLEADLAVVAEPTNGAVSTSQLGSVWTDAAIVGHQAHGGTPWRANDAIAAALEFIRLGSLRAAELPRSDGVRFHPQVGVRIMQGGSHAGTVAGTCRVVTDIRVLPGHDRTQYLRLWDEVAEQVSLAFGVEITLTPYAGGGCMPNEVTDGRMLRLIERAWNGSVNSPFQPCVFYGGSDARYFSAMGVPSVVFGPGDLGDAHAPNESVPILEVEACTRFLEALPRHWNS